MKNAFESVDAYPQPLAGVDEAGRGPWAGPVVAAAVMLDHRSIPEGVNDSKQLKKSARESLFEQICAQHPFGIAQASVEEIDQLNILQASLLAMQRAIEQLASKPAFVLVDGLHLPKINVPARAQVEGDGRFACIAAASILAKVTRDRIMAQLHEQFPHYGWDTNAGYGTAKHRSGIELQGISPHHRRSFAPIRAALENARQTARQPA